jgi:hypothetical protein
MSGLAHPEEAACDLSLLVAQSGCAAAWVLSRPKRQPERWRHARGGIGVFHFTASAGWRGAVVQHETVVHHGQIVAGRIAPARRGWRRLHAVPSARQRITACIQAIAPPSHFPGNAQKRRLTALDACEPRRVTELAVRDIDGLSAALRLLGPRPPCPLHRLPVPQTYKAAVAHLQRVPSFAY